MSWKVDDMWSLDVDTGRWIRLEPDGVHPHARYYHTFLSAPPYVVLYGGEDLEEQAISEVSILEFI